jgi:integrase|nr:tyrosine-type recombinase/integrase [Pseudomonas chengduensis]
MVTQKTTARRFLLSDASVARVNCSGNARQVFHDSHLVGFQMVVGARSRVFRIRLKGSYRTLGHWPVMSAEEARAAALDALKARLGVTARQEVARVEVAPAPEPVGAPKPKTKPAPTLQAVFNEYRNTRKLKSSTADDYQKVFNRYAADWLERSWLAISSDAFEKRFNEVSAKSKAQANQLARIFSAVWSFGAAKHGITTMNPTQRLKAMGGLHHIKPRDGVIPDSLQPRWWRAVESLPDREASAAFIFIALTGCRRGEALRLKTTDIDWQTNTVTFHDTKNGSDHRLPLCRRLYAMLKIHCEGRQGLVFQLSTRRLELMVEHLVNQLQFKWSPHDLRRTFVTIAQRTLKDLATVKRLVNHSVGGDVTMKHYLRLSVEDLREPMQAVEDAFHKIQGVAGNIESGI